MAARRSRAELAFYGFYPVMTFATARRPSRDSFFSLAPWREDFVIDGHFVHDGVSNPVVVANDAESLRLCLSSRPAALISPPRVLCRHRIVTSPQQLQTASRANRREEWGRALANLFPPSLAPRSRLRPLRGWPAGSCCAAALPRLVGDACSRSLCMFGSCFIL